MQFLYQPLTWAFLLVLVPVLIHLINLMRQQRVKWAAMEFLLQSHRKHRRWIWLKQLLLLLLRMLAVAVAVAMLAGLVTQDQWSILGGQATHHFILLDDSLSMSDRSNAGGAFDRANQALRRIAEQLAKRPTTQKLTLLRYSQATREAGSQGPRADLNATLVDLDFPAAIEEQTRQLDATELAVGAGPALELLERLIQDVPEWRREVYLLSDFRANQWGQAPELRESLRRLDGQRAEIHLIRCAREQHQNLAIVEMTPEPGTWAAGVPLLVSADVKNFGPHASQDVQIRFSSQSFPDGALLTADRQIVDDQVTTVVIDEILPGEVASRQAQFKFESPGQHLVEARLVSDAVAADNRRRCLVDLPASIPVLLVDGSGQEDDAYFLTSVFSPGRIVTGIQPMVRSPAYLRDVADTELARFAAIYLLNIERLDPRAVRALERYVNGGGGLAFFMGPLSDPRFLNELYDQGQGLFPLPVQAAKETLRTENDAVPDLQVNDHPIFRALTDEGGKNRPLTRRIRIDRYLPADPAWQPEEHSEVEILATFRGADPLVASRRHGQGQVVVFLTTASPTWNNWALGPSYPVVVLQLHGFLAAPRQPTQARLTGEPIKLQLEAANYRPEIEFHIPWEMPSDSDSVASTRIRKEPNPAPEDSQFLTFALGRNPAGSGRTGETDVSGVYTAQMVTLEGQAEQRRFAVNVPVSESDLALLPSRELAEQFEDLNVQVHDAEELDYGTAGQDGFAWSRLLAMVLVALLMGEQLLAYSASYHPARGGGS